MEPYLSPFKKRLVDNWRKEVNKHLKAGTIYKIALDGMLLNVKEDVNKEIPVLSTVKSQEISTQTSPRMPNTSKQQIIRFSYHTEKKDNQSNRNERLHEGVQSNGVRKNSHRTYYSRNDEISGDNIKTDILDEEPKPLVIIDPQLITPARNYDINPKEKTPRPKTCERVIHNPFKFQSVHKSQESQNKSNDVFVRCQVQSRDRNSFVVSRSNLIQYSGVPNHRFLTLPSRFQNDKQNQQTTTGVSLEKSITSVTSPQRNTFFAVQAW